MLGRNPTRLREYYVRHESTVAEAFHVSATRTQATIAQSGSAFYHPHLANTPQFWIQQDQMMFYLKNPGLPFSAQSFVEIDKLWTTCTFLLHKTDIHKAFASKQNTLAIQISVIACTNQWRQHNFQKGMLYRTMRLQVGNVETIIFKQINTV